MAFSRSYSSRNSSMIRRRPSSRRVYSSPSPSAGVVVAGAEGTLSADLSAVSEAYQERFGRSLVVGASGRTTSDVLRLAVRRLLMDEAGDRSATTAELRQISLRRLRRMIL